MNYKEMASDALAAYDALVEERAAFDGKEMTEEVTAEIADLEARMAAKLEEAEKLNADADRAAKADELRSRTAKITVAPVETIAPKEEPTVDMNSELRSAIVNGTNVTVPAVMPVSAEARANVVKGTNLYNNSDFANAVLKSINENVSVLRAGATVLTTTSGDLVSAPVLTTVNAALVPEAGAIPETNALAPATLSAYKYGAIALLSRELVDDSAFDVQNVIAQQMSRGIKLTAGVKMLTGTGTGESLGVLNAATQANGATAPTAAIDEASLYRLFYSVDMADQGAWIMNGATASAIRGLNSAIWSVNPGTDNPNLLMGRPVIIDNSMPTIAAGAKTVLFGDFSSVVVRSVNGLRVETSNDYKFGNDQVAVRVVWRADVALTDPSSIRFLKHT